MNEEIKTIIEKLKEYLNDYIDNKRVENNDYYLDISEDTLRYWFYEAYNSIEREKMINSVITKEYIGKLEDTDINKYIVKEVANFDKNILKNVLFEVSLDNEKIKPRLNVELNNKSGELDTLLTTNNNLYAIEFKKHNKKVNNKDSGGHPKFVGNLINDFNRLANIQGEGNVKKYQITLIDNKFIQEYEMEDDEGQKLVEKIFSNESNIEIKKDDLKKINNASFKKGAFKSYSIENIPKNYKMKKEIIKIGKTHLLYIYYFE